MLPRNSSIKWHAQKKILPESGGPVNAEANLLLYHPLINMSSHVSTSNQLSFHTSDQTTQEEARERSMRDDFKLSSFLNKRLNMAD